MGRRTDTIDIGRFWSKYVSFILDQIIEITILFFLVLVLLGAGWIIGLLILLGEIAFQKVT